MLIQHLGSTGLTHADEAVANRLLDAALNTRLEVRAPHLYIYIYVYIYVYIYTSGVSPSIRSRFRWLDRER